MALLPRRPGLGGATSTGSGGLNVPPLPPSNGPHESANSRPWGGRGGSIEPHQRSARRSLVNPSRDSPSVICTELVPRSRQPLTARAGKRPSEVRADHPAWNRTRTNRLPDDILRTSAIGGRSGKDGHREAKRPRRVRTNEFYITSIIGPWSTANDRPTTPSSRSRQARTAPSRRALVLAHESSARHPKLDPG